MIRKMFVAAAGLLWFAGTVTAQPLSVPTIRESLDWQRMRLVSTTAGRAEPGRGPASAWQPVHVFDQLRTVVAIDDTVYVVDATGEETRGRVSRLSDVALTVTVDGARREFLAERVSRIDRQRRDPVRNGVLMGLGAGAILGYSVGRRADSPACPRPGIECGQGAAIGTVGGAIWGAVGGWITDFLIRKREVVYLAPGPQ